MLEIAMGLAQFAPKLIGMITGSKNAEAVASKAVDIAQVITGERSPNAALDLIKANPEVALQFKQAILDNEVHLAEISLQRAQQEAAATSQAEADLTHRAAVLEGTASDLKAIPVLGNIMLFLRGAQRPIMGFGMIYLDYMLFSDQWVVPDGDPWKMKLAFFINVLVLFFLFGERAVKNAAPLVISLLKSR